METEQAINAAKGLQQEGYKKGVLDAFRGVNELFAKYRVYPLSEDASLMVRIIQDDFWESVKKTGYEMKDIVC